MYEPYSQITHWCLECGAKLFFEKRYRYFSNNYGCFIHCKKCGIKYIGRDISVCSKCTLERNKECKELRFSKVTTEDGELIFGTK